MTESIAEATAPPGGAPHAVPRSRAPRHHWVVRATHWINAVAVLVMIGSGLRIFNAYPAFAQKGGTFCCYLFEGKPIPTCSHSAPGSEERGTGTSR